MWSLGVDRKQLLEVLGKLGSGDSPSLRANRVEKGESVTARYSQAVLVWSSDPSTVPALPTTIVLPVEGVQDIIGWATTFLSEYVPFSSYFRLVEEPFAVEAFRLNDHQPILGRVSGAAVGMILGELAIRDERKWSPTGPSVSNCSATAAYAIARAVALGYAPNIFREVLDRWNGLRSLVQSRGTRSPLEAILPAWHSLLSLVPNSDSRIQSSLFASQGDVVGRLVHEVAAKRKASRETWSEAVQHDSALVQLTDVLEAPREKRFAWLEQNRSRLVLISSDPRRGPAILGYAVAASAPSGMAHLDYVSDLRREALEAPLWYGLFSGLMDPLGTLRSFGGIGHRLVRELERHEGILDRPRSDIAIAELFTLMRTERATGYIAHTSPGRLEVELIPGVCTTLRWPPGTESASETFVRPQSEELQSKINEALIRSRELAEQLQDVAEGFSQKPKSPKWLVGGVSKKTKKK